MCRECRERFSPAADFKGNCWLAIPVTITACAWRTCRDACRDRFPAVAGKTIPAFPLTAFPLKVVRNSNIAENTKRPLLDIYSWACYAMIAVLSGLLMEVTFAIWWATHKVHSLLPRRIQTECHWTYWINGSIEWWWIDWEQRISSMFSISNQ